MNINQKLNEAIKLLEEIKSGLKPSEETIVITDNGKKTTSMLMKECRKLFSVYSYWDNDGLDENFPAPKKPTKRKFAYTQEPDEKYANMSADDLAKLDVEFMNFRERIIFELEYFKREGKHLDIENITLCAGSRYADGFVPYSHWYSDGGKFRSDWYGSDDANDYLRPRPVVS